MKQRLFYAVVALSLLWAACSKESATDANTVADGSSTGNTEVTNPEDTVTHDRIYQFKVLDGHGDSVSLSQYRGQVLLVVNTATSCGFTPEYTELQAFYESYADQGFTILDFPSNQFFQAQGSFDDIHDFCTSTYNITFPQFNLIDVNGANASPLYVWLKSKKPGDIPWNFTKFVINRKGEVVDRFDARTSSMRLVENSIKKQLNQ